MIFYKKNLFLLLICFLWIQPAGAIKIELDEKTVEKAFREFREILPLLAEQIKKAAPAVGEEIRKTGPVLIDKFNQTTVPAIGNQLRDVAPSIEKNVEKACNQMLKTLRIFTSPLKILPLVGVGLAVSIASIMMLKKGIEIYIDGESDEAVRSKGRKLIAVSLIGLSASGLVIGKSEAIVNYFVS